MKLNAVIYGLPGSGVRILYQDEEGNQVGQPQTIQATEKVVLPVDESRIDVAEGLLEGAS